NYMAPEQALGKSKQVTEAADVYALGGILFAMLTARPPFEADNTMGVLFQVCYQPVTPPSQLRDDLPPELERVCLKCLEKDPTKRYSNGVELMGDLRRYLAAETAPQATAEPKEPRRGERSWKPPTSFPIVPGYEILSEIGPGR